MQKETELGAEVGKDKASVSVPWKKYICDVGCIKRHISKKAQIGDLDFGYTLTFTSLGQPQCFAGLFPV